METVHLLIATEEPNHLRQEHVKKQSLELSSIYAKYFHGYT